LAGVACATATINAALNNRRLNNVHDVLEGWLPRAA
jgi:hypothetical protein